MSKITFLLVILLNFTIILSLPTNNIPFVRQQIDLNSNIHRIVGGTPAVNGEFPGAVSMQTIYGQHYCGGTLIALNFILTAAHCIIYNGNLMLLETDVTIVAGDLKNNWPMINMNRQVQLVERFIPHQFYNELSNLNDIALIKTQQSFFQTSTLYPIEIAQSTALDDQECSVAGWGTTQYEGATSIILLKVDINIINVKVCNESYRGWVSENMICAGDMAGGKDSCQGDSGGALICNKQISGIVSFGNNCALPNYPGVYIDPSQYIDWVTEAQLNSDLTTTTENDDLTTTTENDDSTTPSIIDDDTTTSTLPPLTTITDITKKPTFKTPGTKKPYPTPATAQTTTKKVNPTPGRGANSRI